MARAVADRCEGRERLGGRVHEGLNRGVTARQGTGVNRAWMDRARMDRPGRVGRRCGFGGIVGPVGLVGTVGPVGPVGTVGRWGTVGTVGTVGPDDGVPPLVAPPAAAASTPASAREISGPVDRSIRRAVVPRAAGLIAVDATIAAIVMGVGPAIRTCDCAGADHWASASIDAPAKCRRYRPPATVLDIVSQPSHRLAARMSPLCRHADATSASWSRRITAAATPVIARTRGSTFTSCCQPVGGIAETSDADEAAAAWPYNGGPTTSGDAVRATSVAMSADWAAAVAGSAGRVSPIRPSAPSTHSPACRRVHAGARLGEVDGELANTLAEAPGPTSRRASVSKSASGEVAKVQWW